MPTPTGQILNIGEKFELSDLKAEASIPIKAYAETGQFLEIGYIKLNQRDIWDLQQKKKLSSIHLLSTLNQAGVDT